MRNGLYHAARGFRIHALDDLVEPLKPKPLTTALCLYGVEFFER